MMATSSSTTSSSPCSSPTLATNSSPLMNHNNKRFLESSNNNNNNNSSSTNHNSSSVLSPGVGLSPVSCGDNKKKFHGLNPLMVEPLPASSVSSIPTASLPLCPSSSSSPSHTTLHPTPSPPLHPPSPMTQQMPIPPPHSHQQHPQQQMNQHPHHHMHHPKMEPPFHPNGGPSPYGYNPHPHMNPHGPHPHHNVHHGMGPGSSSVVKMTQGPNHKMNPSSAATASATGAAPSSGPQYPMCFGCNKPISERFLLKAMDELWHEDCLKCSCCDCRLGEVGSTLYTRANLILCKRDYLRLFGSTGICSACSKTIPAFEMVMRAKSNNYHLECFACQRCNHRFCVGDKFYLLDNQVLCEYDYEEVMSHQSRSNWCSSLEKLKEQTESIKTVSELAGQ